jgi:hypothetical protein
VVPPPAGRIAIRLGDGKRPPAGMERVDAMPRRARPGGLWRHPDFLKLWAGQTVSPFGSFGGGFALPLAATPAQFALLSAARLAPGLLIGLFAGV